MGASTGISLPVLPGKVTGMNDAALHRLSSTEKELPPSSAELVGLGKAPPSLPHRRHPGSSMWQILLVA